MAVLNGLYKARQDEISFTGLGYSKAHVEQIDIRCSHMAKTSPGEFVRQVRQEGSKVAWPTSRETTVTSVMVFIMVFIMAAFFLGIDFLLNAAIQFLLGLGV